jgi:hypothetical protein
MKCNLQAGSSLVDAHFAGRISEARERALRLHLPECSNCREHYDRHLLLAALDPNAKSAQERLAFGLGIDASRKPSKSAPLVLALCAAAALLFAVMHLTPKHPQEFAARGSAATTLEPKLLVYRIERGRLPESLGQAMHRTDELAFAYANPGGYERLMIFAVDEHRHVYWYHPEWSNQADDPHAIAIASGAEVREIPAAVSHSFDGSDLTLFAVFSNGDLTVRKVEQMIERSKSLDDPLALPDSVVQKFRLSLEP